MAKIALVSLGCPKNRVDSDTLLERLAKEGFQFTPEAEDAEIIFVNTCGFIEDAKRESIEEILRLRDMKKKGKKLLVFGCLAQRYRNDLLKEIPEIDALWGVGEDEKIIEYCKTVIGNQHSAISTKKADSRQPSGLFQLSADPYSYLKIADGCNRGCTFCVIPSIRGPFQSGNPDAILKKAEEHIASGAKELVLVAQDIGSYGKELGGYGLPSLLKDLAALGGDFWVRLLYLYPTSITDELLTVIAKEEKICSYLDIPLQHSEDSVLSAMGRGGTKEWYRREIKKIREAVPDVVLRTTFIVGFPGESDEHFRGLKAFIEEMRFERLGVFTYSKEEGTPASRLKGAVPRKVKEERRDEIMRLQSRISLEHNKALIGRRFRGLVDEVEGGVGVARLYSQAPEIDGVVILEEEEGAVRSGDFVQLEIVDAYDYDLKGIVVGRAAAPAFLKRKVRS